MEIVLNPSINAPARQMSVTSSKRGTRTRAAVDLGPPGIVSELVAPRLLRRLYEPLRQACGTHGARCARGVRGTMVRLALLSADT